jgi:hypothetical protein
MTEAHAVYKLVGDVNGDGRVDGKDISIMSKSYGQIG